MTAPNLERPTSRTPVTETVAPRPRKALNPMVKFALAQAPLIMKYEAKDEGPGDEL